MVVKFPEMFQEIPYFNLWCRNAFYVSYASHYVTI